MPHHGFTPPRRVDVRTLLWHGGFAVLLVIPAVGGVVGLLVAVLSVPVLVVLFPLTLSLGAIALAVLFWRYRRDRARRRKGGGGAERSASP